jgi:hypothetical protein
LPSSGTRPLSPEMATVLIDALAMAA